MKEIKDYTGEELAEALNSSYQQVNQGQGNIMAIQAELNRRKETKPEIKGEAKK